MTVAAVITTAFVAAIAASTPNSKNQTTALLLIGTIAAGYIENLTLSTTAYLWDPADMGLVTGTMGTFYHYIRSLKLTLPGAIRTALSAIATSMYSSILATESAKNIPAKVGPAALAAGLPSSSLPALLTSIPLGDFSKVPSISPAVIAATGAAVKEAYTSAFRVVYLCTLPFGALLIIAALISPNVEQYLTDEVARKMHKSGEKAESAVRKEVVEA